MPLLMPTHTCTRRSNATLEAARVQIHTENANEAADAGGEHYEPALFRRRRRLAVLDLLLLALDFTDLVLHRGLALEALAAAQLGRRG